MFKTVILILGSSFIHECRQITKDVYPFLTVPLFSTSVQGLTAIYLHFSNSSWLCFILTTLSLVNTSYRHRHILIVKKTYNVRSILLIYLSITVQYSIVHYMHSVVHQITRSFSSYMTETQYPLYSNLPFTFPQSLATPISCFLLLWVWLI